MNVKSCFNTAHFSQWQSSKEYPFNSHTGLSMMVRNVKNTTAGEFHPYKIYMRIRIH